MFWPVYMNMYIPVCMYVPTSALIGFIFYASQINQIRYKKTTQKFLIVLKFFSVFFAFLVGLIIFN